uniref:Uncharacterized protein n=1 Tax=Acrobeloides nanus TaxID=290746 RepID=A0A914DJM2_9BILA
MEALIKFLNANINETIKAQLADDDLVEHMYYIDAITAIPSLCATFYNYTGNVVFITTNVSSYVAQCYFQSVKKYFEINPQASEDYIGMMKTLSQIDSYLRQIFGLLEYFHNRKESARFIIILLNFLSLIAWLTVFIPFLLYIFLPRKGFTYKAAVVIQEMSHWTSKVVVGHAIDDIFTFIMLYLYLVKSQLPSDGKVNNIILGIHHFLNNSWIMWGSSTGTISNEQPVGIVQLANQDGLANNIGINQENVELNTQREVRVKIDNSIGTSTGLPQFKHKAKSNDNFSMNNRHELSSRLLRSNSLILTPSTLDTNISHPNIINESSVNQSSIEQK